MRFELYEIRRTEKTPWWLNLLTFSWMILSIIFLKIFWVMLLSLICSMIVWYAASPKIVKKDKIGDYEIKMR